MSKEFKNRKYYAHRNNMKPSDGEVDSAADKLCFTALIEALEKDVKDRVDDCDRDECCDTCECCSCSCDDPCDCCDDMDDDYAEPEVRSYKRENRPYYRPVLTLEERDFLKHVVRPFRDVIKSISIQPADVSGKEFLSITYIADRGNRFITFPSFDARRQYKGLEREVNYRLNDLDL